MSKEMKKKQNQNPRYPEIADCNDIQTEVVT